MSYQDNEINYNHFQRVKQSIEALYLAFVETHNEYLRVIEDVECFDDEKINEIHSTLMEYDAELDKMKASLFMMQSKNKTIRSYFNQTRLMKKARLTKIESKMNKPEDDDDGLPF